MGSVILSGILPILLLFPAVTTLDTYKVDSSDGLGRRFDGIGGLSGGGATSKLLVNYPDEQRDQILDYLFKPQFGASLHILKVEIGGDAQSTDGSEASHMHNSWDENYERGYEWWLMTEAKKRNPDILLYCLPWAFPAWVGDGKRNPYNNPQLTASYVIKYILGAKQHYNLTMDYVGIWNERAYDSKYIKVLRAALDTAGLQHTRIVAADGLWEPIAVDIQLDQELANAVDYIGVHYPGTKGSKPAVNTGKQLWSSEDYSTFNDNVGAGCWARILNQNYVNGNMTSTISWNLIASYYEALPFKRNGLMTADSPWSGNYVIESPIWVTAHTTQFTQPGWMYYRQGSGSSLLTHGGSMVSLVSPDSTQLTMVLETMSRNHSICVRPYLPPYDVAPQNITIQLTGGFTKLFKMNIWYSKLGFGGQDTTMMKNLGSKLVVNGKISLTLGVDEVYTLTTLGTGNKGDFGDIPPTKSFPLPYTDDFESYKEHQEPNNLAQQIGVYEVVRTTSPADPSLHPSGHPGGQGAGNQVIRQMVLELPCHWCQAETVNSSLNIIGDYGWSEIYVEADTHIGPVNGTSATFVAARVNKGGCNSLLADGVFFFYFSKDGYVEVTGDLARTQQLFRTNITVPAGTWTNLALLVKGGRASGTLNGHLVFNITLGPPPAPQNGFVALGTAEYGLADFDNLKIMNSLDGEQRMHQMIRGQQQVNGYSLDDVKSRINEEMVHKEIDIKHIADNVEIKEVEENDTLYFKPRKQN